MKEKIAETSLDKIKITKKRTALIDELQRRYNHPTAEELYLSLKNRFSSFGTAADRLIVMNNIFIIKFLIRLSMRQIIKTDGLLQVANRNFQASVLITQKINQYSMEEYDGT